MDLLQSTSLIMISDTYDYGNLGFHYDEEIIEAINVHDYHWDDMHHHAYVFSLDAFILKKTSKKFSIESKNFIPFRHVDLFKNSIPTY